MGLFVNSLDLLERGVRIYLRGLDALVAQQLPHILYSGIMIEQGCCKRMSQDVGRPLLQRCDKA